MDRIMPGGFALIDLNAACPVEKITRKGKGASLLKDAALLRSLLKAMVAHAAVPVTVKIRAGWDNDSVNARDIALYAEDAGVAAVTIHGRTKMQGYGGRVDYEVIRQVKESLSIPLIASGDAFSPQLIKRMFDETGCDGVAVARGSLGNPWIFRDASAYLEKAAIPDRPSSDEIAEVMQRHLRLNCDFYGEDRGVVLFRKLFAWYVKGLHEVRPLKHEAFYLSSAQEMAGLIERVRDYRYCHHDGNYDGYPMSPEMDNISS
jgi:tRNA-dihydrouridine synthase B